MTIHDSTNPRHYLHPEQGFFLAIMAVAILLGFFLHGCKLPDVGPVTPGTTTTTTTTTTSTTIPPVPDIVALPEALYGGIGAGDWVAMSAPDYAFALANAGCNSHLIEACAPLYDKSEDGFNSLPFDAIVAPLAAWIRAMQAARIWTVIHWANDNDGVLQRYGLTAHKAALKQLADEVGTAYIVLIPVAEMDSDEANEFSAFAISYWHGTLGGICGWNGRGRPQTVPEGVQVCDYHLQALDDLGPDLRASGVITLLDTDNGPAINSLRASGVITLLDTDNGPAINSLRAYWNPDKVQNWVGVYHKAGRSLNLYQFQSTETDTQALRRVGEAYR